MGRSRGRRAVGPQDARAATYRAEGEHEGRRGGAVAGGRRRSSLVVADMCEGCVHKQPHFGLREELKKRWCGGCAGAGGEGRAVRLDHAMMCEGCDLMPRDARPDVGLRSPKVRSHTSSYKIHKLQDTASPGGIDPSVGVQGLLQLCRRCVTRDTNSRCISLGVFV